MDTKRYILIQMIMLMKIGWIKATLVNRATIKAKPGEKEVVFDYNVGDVKFDEDTDFDIEKPSITRTLNLQIPVLS
jgi:hypothetical protein